MSPRGAQRAHSHRSSEAKNMNMVLLAFVLLAIPFFLSFFAFFRRTWDGKREQNIVIVPNIKDGPEAPILFLHVVPDQQEIRIVRLPANAEVKVLGGYGNYPLRSVWGLMRLEKKPERFYPAAFSYALKEAVDQVWVSDKKEIFAEGSKPNTIFDNLVFYEVHAPLTWTDRLWLANFARGLRPDQLKVTEVRDLQEWEKAQSQLQFPSQARDCSLSVVNTTQVSGVGNISATTLEKSGLSVIRVTDIDQSTDHTVLALQQELPECASVLEHIGHLFPFPIKTEIRTDILSQYRSNIVLFVGKDFSNEIAKEKKPAL
jgi:hypothetical protein